MSNNETIKQNLAVVPGISDHEMVTFDIYLKPKRKRALKRRVFIKKKANIDKIKDDMMFFCDFYMIHLIITSVDNKWNELEKALKTTTERNIPCSITSSRFNLPWFNRAHRRLCKKKQRLYNRAKSSSNEADWASYRSAKKLIEGFLD